MIYPPKALKLCNIASLSYIFGDFSGYDGVERCLFNKRCLNYPLRYRGLYVSVKLYKDSSSNEDIRTNKLLKIINYKTNIYDLATKVKKDIILTIEKSSH